MRLIDGDALMADIERTVEESGCVNHEGDIMDCVRYAPTISAVPVVRCGECKYAVWEKEDIKYCETWGAKCDCPYEIALTATDYCSLGAKMEDKP